MEFIYYVWYCCSTVARDLLQTLLYEVVAQPLHHQVALPRGHGLVVDADHQRLPGLLQGQAS